MASDQGRQKNAQQEQAMAALMELPASMRLGIVGAYFAVAAGVAALRDTVLAKLGGWALSRLAGTIIGSLPMVGRRCTVPAGPLSVILHLHLFFSRQSSWRKAAATLRRLLSRNEADDRASGEFTVHAFEAVLYVFLSVVFRNIAVLFSWAMAVLLPLSSVVILWFVTVDRPVQTFGEHASAAWALALPPLSSMAKTLVSVLRLAALHSLRLLLGLSSASSRRRDRLTAAWAATLGDYRYSPLAPGEIRLLKLSKRAPWSPVRCELAPVALEGAPQFETISYTWGAQPGTKLLVVNGSRLTVSERVYDIVHDRAAWLTTRYVWIDSICINQRDDREKTAQVQLMRHIYGSSRRTIVWLGYAVDANDAVHMMAHIARRIQTDDADERRSRPLDQLSIASPHWPALNRLLQHEYWRRCWVIQEIAVSREVIISYGGELITWAYFASLVRLLFSADFNSVWHISKIYPHDFGLEAFPMEAGLQIVSLSDVRESIVRHEHESLDLFSLLTSSVNSTATDVRDNIYAVQGISTADLTPDYTAPIERPFCLAAEDTLRRRRGLHMLHYTGIGFGRSRQLRHLLPSWVPDWSAPRVSRPYWQDASVTPYRASAGLRPVDAVDAVDAVEMAALASSDGGSTLVLSGVIIVDHIAEPGPRFFGVSENGVRKKERFPGGLKDVAACRDMVMNGGFLEEPYVTGIPLIEALWRTLTCDRRPEDHARPADPSFFQHYQALENLTSMYARLLGPDMAFATLTDPAFVESGKAAEFMHVSNLHAVGAGRFANASTAYTRERMFALTKKGYMGLVPPFSERGDVVCIIPGAQVPFLLRRCDGGSSSSSTGSRSRSSNSSSSGGDQRWQLVGETYFHGMMDGEMVEGGVEETIVLC